ncbi:bifunctional riboflavin kinase/FAD synthetase [Segetibacter aerophilus]|uniref:Riboflavin biosynthesis protein n=1 Tax=Segetibacter aerophilus TaxID=670293 RepID=A0A512B9F0_9BACT|nr:bifunctional riboflavin kinase/FAD synthetase [Segetibacter aerophilus]GEO08596.1 riboflavin biosynthesis protein [Segetibacter aerophilus]
MIQVHRDLDKLPKFKNAVITIGTFDGVHLGHQQIIKLLKQHAASNNGETVIITFHPHPRKVVAQGKTDVKILNTLPEKIELLDKLGIDHLVVVAFDDAFANQTAEEYVTNFLVKKFAPQIIIIGYDHKFGKNRSGDYHLLEKLGERFGYEVKEIPEHVLNEIIISSTKIREALFKSDVNTANNFLGYQYFFEGKVVVGNKLGRTIGYPTANLAIEEEEKLVPGNGVYAVKLKIEGTTTIHGGMMNIGVRPTVDGSTRTIEINIFDFDQDVYGQKMRVSVCAYLRGEVKFAGLDELKNQLAKDKIEAQQKLSA